MQNDPNKYNYKGALKIKKFSIVIILLIKYFILGTDLFAQDFSQAKRILENSIESGDLKMVTALVGNKDEEIFHASFGTRDKDGEANMTKDTITHIGSMTKLITTIANGADCIQINQTTKPPRTAP